MVFMPFLDDHLDFFMIYCLKGSLADTDQEASWKLIPS